MTRCVPIDEAGVFEAFEAVESDDAKIRCQNECYDPVDVTVEAIRAAATRPQCGECGAVNLFECEGDGGDRDE